MPVVHPVCVRFHRAVELIGARWSGAILRALFTGQHRFAGIKAAIPGISDTMLAQRLRELEAASVVDRQVVSTSPLVVEYRLTERGLELAPVMDALTTWAHRWIEPSGAEPTTAVT
ncbi:winged helix-turn-helix transcriptional regulator [Nakamurella deserti]|uniref:winged helix-turn-helix transcriptional regulator n=1 Tax=Nakamurella deserti TaxID=2164074 RepID=UPI000DBE98FC|nr:helix-turn-helix domain-containing protein [Nakamurella deserti]